MAESTYDREALDLAIEAMRREQAPPPMPPQIAVPEQSETLSEAQKNLLLEIASREPPSFMRSVRDLGSKFASAVANPIDEGLPALGELAKGAASGASAGLTEHIPGLAVDPESWAGSAGRIGGFIAPVGAISKGLMAVKGVRALGNLGTSALAGGVVSGAEAAIRPQQPGEEPRSPMKEALLGTAYGVAVPLGLKTVGYAGRKAIEKMFGRRPPMPPTGTTPPGTPPPTPPPGGAAGQAATHGANDFRSGMSDFSVGSQQTASPTAGEAQSVIENILRGPTPVTARAPYTVPTIAERGARAEDLRKRGGGWGLPGQPGVDDVLPLGGQPVPEVPTPPVLPVRDVPPPTFIPGREPFRSGMSSFSLGGGPTPPPPPPPPPATPAATPSPTPPPARGGAAVTGTGRPGVHAASATEMAGAEPSGLRKLWETTKDVGRSLNLPSRIYAKDPAARSVYHAIHDASDAMENIAASARQSLAGAVNDLSPTAKETLKQLRLDYQGKPGINAAIMASGDPEAAQILAANNRLNAVARTHFDKLLNLGLVKEDDFVENYIPMLRPRIVKRGGVEVVIGDEWVPVAHWRVPERASSHMVRERNLDLPISEKMRGMTLDEALGIQAKAYARVVATEEQLIRGAGQGGSITRVGPREVSWLESKMAQVHDPSLQSSLMTNLNDYLGRPRGMTERYPWFGETVQNIRSMEFYHYIAASPIAGIVNLTQNLIPMAMTSSSAFGKSVWSVATKQKVGDVVRGVDLDEAIRNMRVGDFAQKFMGASGKKFHGDVNLIEPKFLGSRRLGNIADKAAIIFRSAEAMNQEIASMAGYFDALARGLNHTEALKIGRELNRYANKLGGPENTPEAFRQGFGSLLGQFKSFQIGMAGITVDFAKSFAKGAQQIARARSSEEYQEGVRQMMPMVKYVIGLTALIGPTGVLGKADPYDQDSTVNGARLAIQDAMEKYIPRSLHGGLVGMIGANLSNQIGVGALPITTVDEIMRFIPGPFASSLSDAMSVTTYMIDRAKGNVGPYAGSQVSLDTSKMGTGMSPDQAASFMTRLFPIGGPQLDRIRKWVKSYRSDWEERSAYNVLQGFGIEQPPPTTQLIREEGPQPPLYEVLGLPRWVDRGNPIVFNPASRQEDIERRSRMMDEGVATTRAIRDFASMYAAGDIHGAMEYKQRFEDRHGYPLVVSREAINAAYERANVPSTERLERRIQVPIRRRELEMESGR